MKESVLLGFRSWKIIEDRLYPLKVSDNLILRSQYSDTTDIPLTLQWNKGINKSLCVLANGEDTDLFSSPHIDHDCGFNAFFEFSRSKEYLERGIIPYPIVGAIAGSGNMQIHPKGFRSEQAQILALLVNDIDLKDKLKVLLLKNISKHYAVPIFLKEQAFLEYVHSLAPSIEDYRIPKTYDKNYRNSWRNLIWPLDSVDDEPSLCYEDERLWYKDDVLHREGDKPAYIDERIKKWYRHGELWREGDKPNYIEETEDLLILRWMKDGALHRDDDKPAYILYSKHSDDNKKKNTEIWFQHGKEHRDNGLPAFVSATGTKVWYDHGTIYDSEGRDTKSIFYEISKNA